MLVYGYSKSTSCYKTPFKLGTFRLMAYENTLELVKERPLIGYGTGSFEKVFGNHVKYKYSDWRNRKISDPHNQYLFIVFENGLIGLLIFLCFLLSPFFVKLQKKDSYYYIGIGVLLTWSMTSFFSSHFRTFSEGHLVAFFIGVMFSSQNRLITRRQFFLKISAIVITHNEENNILACLESIRWVDEIIVVDTHSTDKTVELARRSEQKFIKRLYGMDLDLKKIKQ